MARRLVAYMLILLFVLIPWIQVSGRPAVFLDLGSLRFHFFGFTLLAEEFWILFFCLTGFGFLLFFITAILGRVWCGWACPQTVFLEHLFRRIEAFIDGNPKQRRALENSPWTDKRKILKRVLKHGIFLFLCVVIAHLVLAYFVSIPRLYGWVKGSPEDHLSAFLFIVFFSGILYFNFAWFREQLCLAICPYGRLQSALIDDHSLIIGYDEKRGEPRGRANDPANGDCINCYRCVEVCPTGIDIRQGLQIECIGCANCIDACDEVMRKIDRPEGLVRYDSLNGFAGKKTLWLRPRILFYLFMGMLGASAFAYAATTLRPELMVVGRAPGSSYYVDEGGVRNHFRVRIFNKLDAGRVFSLEVEDLASSGLYLAGEDQTVEVPPMGEVSRLVVVQVPFESFSASKLSFEMVVRAADGRSGEMRERLEFLGPNPELLREDFKVDQRTGGRE